MSKLLVVSHACVTPANQRLYADFAALTGWHVDLVVPAAWQNEYGSFVGGARLPAFHGTLLPMPVWRPGDIIKHAYRASFKRLIADRDPDVIYVAEEPYALATAQVYWGNMRASGSRRRPIGCYSAQNIYKRRWPPVCWIEPCVLRSSAFAFPVSSDTLDVMTRKGLERDRAAILPLGVDLEMHRRPCDKLVVAARRRMAGPASDGSAADVRRPLLAYVGRFVPEKGLATLVTALANPALCDCHLALIGDGPQDAALRALASRMNCAHRVTFLGYVPHDQIAAYLAAADLLVLPSETRPGWKEQFGRVLLEAMACGTAVVGSDSGEIPRLLDDTGGGLTFREGDAADLARVAATLIRDPLARAHDAERGRRSVVDRYDLRALASVFASRVLEAADRAADLPVPFQLTQESA